MAPEETVRPGRVRRVDEATTSGRRTWTHQRFAAVRATSSLWPESAAQRLSTGIERSQARVDREGRIACEAGRRSVVVRAFEAPERLPPRQRAESLAARGGDVSAAAVR